MFARLDYDFFTVAAVCSGATPPIHAPKIQLRAITTSSLEVQPASLFVPLIDRRDGHDFIADALRRGAAAFFARKGHPVLNKLNAEQRALAIAVDDPLLALGRLAAFHRNRFSPLVIGVTGSNGKTTTKEMLAQIFRRALGKKCIATRENFNNHIGVPFTLFAIGKDTRVAIVEMGMNHAGEISYLSQLARPDSCVISSIGHAHIEFFASRAGIAAAKAEITEGMRPGGFFYVPQNVAEFKTLSAAAKQSGARIRRVAPGDYPVAAGNAVWLSNFSLAAAVARDQGIKPEVIFAAARSFKPAKGRMQVKKGRYTVIDDGYNANPDSAIASIDAALALAGKRPVVCVFGDFKEMGRFSRKLHAWTGDEAARKGVKVFYGVGKDMAYAVQAFGRRTRKKKRAYQFPREHTQAIIEQLRLEPADSVILVKGSRAMKMEEIADALTAKTG